ncbi:MAG: helix-turn-helix domain-containing protein [Steroidobacteraceae bacterium]|jgi:putative transcriptional regulator
MATTKRNLFEEIRAGLESYRDHPRALTRREFSAPDVKSVREKFGMSQADMATFLNVSKRTLENWEQGRRGPTGPAQTLLRIMEREPKAVRRALRDDRTHAAA